MEPASQLPEISPGEIIGGYRLERVLGAGSTSRVYAATHVLLGRRAAIKVLAPGLVSNQAVVNRLLNEARVVNDIGHPNIADVIDFVVSDTPRRVALVMEHVEGPSLKSLRTRPLSREQALAVSIQVVDALSAAHAIGVIHRDLKPDNVLLTAEPSSDPRTLPVAKIVDFGIAKLVGQSGGTLSGTMLGTPAYMAPEQIAGRPAPSTATDVYAVGELIYELFAAERAFPGASTPEIIELKITGTIPKLPMPPVLGREALLALVRACLARRPSERPSLTEVREALVAQLPSGLELPPPSTSERLRREASRTPEATVHGDLGRASPDRPTELASASDPAADVSPISLPPAAKTELMIDGISRADDTPQDPTFPEDLIRSLERDTDLHGEFDRETIVPEPIEPVSRPTLLYDGELELPSGVSPADADLVNRPTEIVPPTPPPGDDLARGLLGHVATSVEDDTQAEDLARTGPSDLPDPDADSLPPTQEVPLGSVERAVAAERAAIAERQSPAPLRKPSAPLPPFELKGNAAAPRGASAPPRERDSQLAPPLAKVLAELAAEPPAPSTPPSRAAATGSKVPAMARANVTPASGARVVASARARRRSRALPILLTLLGLGTAGAVAAMIVLKNASPTRAPEPEPVVESPVATPAAARRTRTIMILSNPGGAQIRDLTKNLDLGTAPQPVDVPEGAQNHRIRVEIAGFEVVELDVADAEGKVWVELKPTRAP